MLIFTKISDLRNFLDHNANSGKKVGFVPTMGALHKGHLYLIESACQQCEIVVCSIFVNPTQFNDPKDLERYPRTPESDIELLQTTKCDALFLPDANEIYPVKDERQFDFGLLDKVLDGKHRPGHFNGVAQVVSKLFAIVQPHAAFFGLKDLQQVCIIKKLVRVLALNIEIVACPTYREKNGLAMSSRNMLLTEEQREQAVQISKYLFWAQELFHEKKSAVEIKNIILNAITNNPNLSLDYFSICELENLQEVNEFNINQKYAALIACTIGKIRLIDNVIL
ncbi:MAG: pantoate--beta-alanine ligase [Sphingobacteriaceae bacterium]|nr:pantoate--beta-alanine ligase [Sphingobacteriaceae bacterium]